MVGKTADRETHSCNERVDGMTTLDEMGRNNESRGFLTLAPYSMRIVSTPFRLCLLRISSDQKTAAIALATAARTVY